jgi:hypothetical protein
MTEGIDLARVGLTETCPKCDGAGYAIPVKRTPDGIRKHCAVCHGSGRRVRSAFSPESAIGGDDGYPTAWAYEQACKALERAKAGAVRLIEFWSDIEARSSDAHDVYQKEAHRRGDVRHADAYADLSEPTKEWDRVLVRWVLDETRRILAGGGKP